MEKPRSTWEKLKSSLVLPLALAISVVSIGCADRVQKCLGDTGKDKKAQIEKMVLKCARDVKRHGNIGNDDLTRDSNAANRAFRRGDNSCDEAIVEAKRVKSSGVDALRRAEDAEDSSKAGHCNFTVDWATSQINAAGGSERTLHAEQK